MGILRRPLDGRGPGWPRWLHVALWPALAGHALAGAGLYWDVAWHIDIGRDEELLTAPHTLIVAGLLVIALSAVAGLFAAARDGRRVPRSLVAAAFSAGVAVIGFPLDELWHQARGIDVTMWSPTHLLMIGGGGLSVAPLWFALGEAGVDGREGRGARMAHALVAVTLLGGLSAFQGEFDFGVPQFQLLYHPVLVVLAGTVVLTAVRAVLGRGAALAVAAAFLLFRGAVMLFVGVAADRTIPAVGLYLGIALTIELVALLRPPERGLLPYALLGGAATGTLGLATEWVWAGSVARHPWTAALLPEGVLVPLLAALGGALLGAAAATGLRVRLRPLPVVATAAGAVLVVAALLIPLPRTGDMAPQAAVTFEPLGDEAHVRVVIGPPDAPHGARWWEVLAWQGGGVRIAQLLPEEGSGVYRTAVPVPVTGDWKVALRLHRGSDILAADLRHPADPLTGEEALEPQNGFVSLQREDAALEGTAREGAGWLAPAVLSISAALALGWAWLTVRAAVAARAASAPPPPPVPPRARPGGARGRRAPTG